MFSLVPPQGGVVLGQARPLPAMRQGIPFGCVLWPLLSPLCSPISSSSLRLFGCGGKYRLLWLALEYVRGLLDLAHTYTHDKLSPQNIFKTVGQKYMIYVNEYFSH